MYAGLQYRTVSIGTVEVTEKKQGGQIDQRYNIVIIDVLAAEPGLLPTPVRD